MTNLAPQRKKPVDISTQKTAIAFNGGGVAALTHIGVFNSLYENGRIGTLNEVSGTSSGSMMAGLVALGYRGKDLYPMTIDQDFSWFTDFSTTREKLNALPNMIGEKSGIFTGKPLRKWMEHAIAKKTGKPDMTFAELHQWRLNAKQSLETGDLKFFEDAAYQAFEYEVSDKFEREYKKFNNEKNDDGSYRPFTLEFNNAEELRNNILKMSDFHVAASEVIKKDGKTEYKETLFSYKNPELANTQIAQAVEASASFPFIFAREKINGKIYTDGGVTNNFPIEPLNGKYNPDLTSTIGIAVSYESKKPTSKQFDTFRKAVNIRNSIFPNNRWNIKNTLTVAKQATSKNSLTDKYSDIIISAELDNVSSTNFNISRDRKLELINKGYEQGVKAIEASDREYGKPHNCLLPKQTNKPNILPPHKDPNNIGWKMENLNLSFADAVKLRDQENANRQENQRTH